MQKSSIKTDDNNLIGCCKKEGFVVIPPCSHKAEVKRGTYGLRKFVQNSRPSKKDCKNWETRQYFTVPKEHKYDTKVSQSFLTKLIARDKVLSVHNWDLQVCLFHHH